MGVETASDIFASRNAGMSQPEGRTWHSLAARAAIARKLALAGYFFSLAPRNAKAAWRFVLSFLDCVLAASFCFLSRCFAFGDLSPMAGRLPPSCFAVDRHCCRQIREHPALHPTSARDAARAGDDFEKVN
jgi:hypothetical protein